MTIAIQSSAANRPAPGLSAAVRSEAIKLWSLPSHRALMTAAIALSGIAAAFFYATLPVTQGRPLSALAPHQVFGAGVLGVDASTFVLIALSAVFVGSEFTSGMIQTTATLTPDRTRFLTAKLLTIGAAVLIIGVLAAALCILVTVVAGGLVSMTPAELFPAENIRLAAGSVAMPVVYAILAATGTFVFRSAALGALVPLAIMAIGGVAEWFGAGFGAMVTPLLPVSAIHSLTGTASGNEAIGLGWAFVSLAAWIAIASLAAGRRLTRRDI